MPGEPDVLKLVAAAIKEAWDKFSDVPFPLYDSEAEALAAAAIECLAELERARRGES